MIGYIKLHRKILEWEWYDDANTFRLFIHCLIEANHKDKEWRGINICRGQFHTSIGSLATKLKLSDKAIRIALDKLVKTKEVIIKRASNGTMITICNYDSYEETEGQTEGQTKGKPKGKRGATTNNVKNDLTMEEYKQEERQDKTKPKKTLFDFSFVDDKFKEAFDLWLAYKAEIKSPYKTQTGLEGAYKELIKYSEGNSDFAMLVVEQSIAKEWKGLFELKNKPATNNTEQETMPAIITRTSGGGVSIDFSNYGRPIRK